jgi:hypothetical protein
VEASNRLQRHQLHKEIRARVDSAEEGNRCFEAICHQTLCCIKRVIDEHLRRLAVMAPSLDVMAVATVTVVVVVVVPTGAVPMVVINAY